MFQPFVGLKLKRLTQWGPDQEGIKFRILGRTLSLPNKLNFGPTEKQPELKMQDKEHSGQEVVAAGIVPK